MTISSTVRSAGPYTGNGVQTAFTFAFKVFVTTDVKVTRTVTSTGVVTTKTLGSDYSVALNTNQSSNPGGVITMAVAVPSTDTLNITSQVPYLQPTDLALLGGFYPSVINDSLDRATVQIQQLIALVGSGGGGSGSGVTSFNTRTGAVTLTSADISTALGFTPASSTGSTVYTPADGKPVVTTIDARLQLLDGVSPSTTVTDSYSAGAVNAYRNGSALTGGTGGFVNTNIAARTTAGASEVANEWVNLAILDNYANTIAQNVAVYGQANRYGTSPTFAGCFEFRDQTGNQNPVAGCLGIEVDVFANGTDTGFNRVIIDVTTGKGVAGAACEIGHGIRVGGAVGEASFQNGITIGAGTGGDSGAGTDAMRTALAISTNGTWGINMTGTQTVGIDLSGSTHSSAAIRIKGNEYIALEATGAIKYKYNSSNGFIEFYQGASRRGYIDALAGADVNFGAGVQLTGNQTIAGIKTFSNYINAAGGIVVSTAGVLSDGNIDLNTGVTVGFTSSGGNTRANAGSNVNQVRVRIDGTSVWIPYYT